MAKNTTTDDLLTRRRLASVPRQPREIGKWVRGHARIAWHKWRADDWQEFYLRMTTTADEDPFGSVGPNDMFEEMATWQHSHLVETVGLQPDDVLVDVGCGVLRGGIPLIEYLDPESYYGLDIDAAGLRVGRRRLREQDLQHKRPTLINNTDLQFGALEGVEADVIWAQSLWTHLPPDRLAEFVAHAPRILAPGGEVHATYFEGDAVKSNRTPYHVDINWDYPFEHLADLAAEHGLTAHRSRGDHPNDHDLVRMERG